MRLARITPLGRPKTNPTSIKRVLATYPNDPHARHRALRIVYLYWCERLSSADPQQVLFAMDCTGRYINPTAYQLRLRKRRNGRNIFR